MNNYPSCSVSDDEDLEMGSEDVFDDDAAENQTSLTFVTSDYANEEQLDNICDQNRNCLRPGQRGVEQSNTSDKDSVDISLNANEVASRFQDSLKKLPDVVVHKVTSETNNLDTGQKSDNQSLSNANTTEQFTDKIDDSLNNNTEGKPIPPKTLDLPTNNNEGLDSGTVSKIAMHRSYATGDSTFSVAVRSGSPYPPSIRHKHCDDTRWKTGAPVQGTTDGQFTNNLKADKPCIQENSSYNCNPSRSFPLENYMLEIMLFLSGATFFALFFDIPPHTFILEVLLALIIRLTLRFIMGFI